MDSIGFVFSAFLGGLVALLEELTLSWRYSLPTLALSAILGASAFLLLSRVIRNRYCAWALAGAWVALIAATIRIGLVLGLQAIGGANLIATAVVFIPSGAIAGVVVARFQRDGLTIAGAVIGIALGVLYHLQLAQGWMSVRPFEGTMLFLMEFLGPAVFAILTILWFRLGRRAFYRGAGLEK
jgi:hypothetical protein